MEIKPTNSFELVRDVQENLKANKQENPILNRLVDEHRDPETLARQAYDRMYHKHNRTKK